jgi:hypothetical protein
MLRGFHKAFIRRFTQALPRIFTPLNTGERIVINHEAAVFTDSFCIYTEYLDLVSALRTDLFHNPDPRFTLASFHDHETTSSLRYKDKLFFLKNLYLQIHQSKKTDI